MRNIAAGMWAMLGGDEETLDALELVGDGRVLPSVFDVTGLATAAVGVASLAAAELAGIRNQCEVEPVRVTTWEASAAFRCENLFVAVEGWELPPVWDPLAGDYQGADGWIRLHTNYAHHRAAALRALRLEDPSRETVAATVADWPIAELETRVVEEGGASAAMYSHEAWIGHPQGRATAAEPPIGVVSRPGGSTRSLPPSERPLGEGSRLDAGDRWPLRHPLPGGVGGRGASHRPARLRRSSGDCPGDDSG